MRLNKNKITLLIFFLSLPLGVLAQNSDPYTFPIRPNKSNFLSGTMGELRSSHFHAGIDIKTGGKIGEPVHATKRGYITRIKVSSSGYGNALYMLHPDGNTSVYAHLEEFAPDIQEFVKKEQYKNQKFEIELFPKPYQFAFKSQEVIGLSGNTGGSLGPHLHFEIRDSQQRVLNPLHYGFDEVRDNIPPILQGFAIRPMNINARVFNKYDWADIRINRNGFNYKAIDTVKAIGNIGLELWGHDKLNGSANKNGISIIEMKVNGETHFKQDIDVMSFSLQRHILVHYPYDVKKVKGPRYHKLYIDDGNRLKFYETLNEDGTLKIENGKTYNIEINMYDPYENMSTLELIIQGKEGDKFIKESIDFELDEIDYKIEGDILKVFTNYNCEDESEELNLNLNGEIESLKPNYFLNTTAIYLWDLKKGIPESVLNCDKGMNLQSIHEIIPKESKAISTEKMNIEFSPYSLFDTLYLETAYEIKSTDSLEVFSLGPITSPLKSSIEIELMPSKKHYNQDKSHVYKTDDSGNFSFTGGEWKNEKLIFSTRDLADYTILTDTTPPLVKESKKKYGYIIDDKLSGIKSFEAFLNGEWILMKYEPKDNLIWIDWPIEEITKTGNLIITVKDNAGNETNYNTKL
ncbi:M23 family metallopeptidase [Marivirga tractuosa]|uniref:M23 family metallopeptidase n=1 Tax=Marivirga tractuosa TaxID=1006 RepID=UPI0035D0F070